MKRKLIGTVKVYATEAPGCITYETVWPKKLYDRVHGPHRRRLIESVRRTSHHSTITAPQAQKE